MSGEQSRAFIHHLRMGMLLEVTTLEEVSRMPRDRREKEGGRRGEILVPQAEEEMEALKEEVARQLDLDDDIARRGWENMTTREVGKIGGQMVRRLVRKAEQDLAREERAGGNEPAKK